jgi:tripartite-type tricarboxylate transporter receptor subunit TctC
MKTFSALLRLGALACTAAFTASASAQDYPKKPITLTVAYAASSPVDLALRMAMPRLNARLGQPVILVNRPGGGGTIATEAVMSAGTDGYTLLVNGDQMVVTPHLFGKTIRYDVFRDFIPITRLITVPFALLVGPTVPASTFGEFVAVARARPGKLTYATPGTGTSNHLSMEWLKVLAGFDALHIPFKGAAAVNDVAAGRIDSILISIQNSAPMVKSGKLKALAVTGPARFDQLPGTPTFAEAGYAEFDAATTFGMLAVTGTPAEIVQRLHAEFTGALKAPEVQKQVNDMGTIVTADTPAEFAKKLRADYERYGRIIRENKIQPE